MRILWICNLILPEFSSEYNIKKTPWEGWISGMMKLIANNPEIELACCFPIMDEARMRQGAVGKVLYYSFHAIMDRIEAVQESAIVEFVKIYQEFNPDVIHIWGSEYTHSKAAVDSANRLRLGNRVVVHIQGLVSAIAPYYNFGVNNEWLDYSCNGKTSMRNDALGLYRRGVLEIETYNRVGIVLGRTSWDKAYIKQIAPRALYKICNEVLRTEFYGGSDRWDVKKCEKHSILVSQAGYALKGVHLILPAIKRLNDEFGDIKLYVGGPSAIATGELEKQTPYDRYILSLIEEYDIKDCVIFTDRMDAGKMKERFLNSHIFVSSSTIENSSNAIGEAQFLGVPVVATYTGGTPDLVEHEKTGLLYQMDAPYMFADCVRRIFDDDEFAMKLSKEAQKVAKERYDPERVSEELISIYEEVAGKNVSKKDTAD